ncbi:MAG TPA: hypothetical protein VF195_05685 [Actinomycetota bacterium]
MRAIDLAYHVRAGELSLRTGDLLLIDPFTFTSGARPWLNQQWVAQLVFASAHRLLGWAGVAITYAGAMASGFGLLYRSCRRAKATPRTAAVLALLGFMVASGSLAARPQALAVPLFTGTWLLLARRHRWMWGVPVLAVIWANVHGSFVLAPGLVAFTLCDDLLERKDPRPTLLLLLATAGATFATPFGGSVWTYALDLVGNETIRSSVAEWRPPSPLSLSGGPFWASAVAVAIVGISKRREIRLIDVARLLVFFALGVPALRGTLWWALVAPPIVAGWFPARDPVDPAKSVESRWVPTLVATAIVLMTLAFALNLRAGTDPVTGGPARLAADAPEDLAIAARKILPPGSRLLVFQPFASWFEYSLPEDPVMVDSRIELFPSTVWRDYSLATRADRGWERVLDRYGIRGVVLPPGEPLGVALAHAPGWTLGAQIPSGSIFVRS